MSEGTAPAIWKSVVAGSSAGLCEVLVMYPTDVAKTRQQLSMGKTVPMVRILRSIVIEEGATNLYRGLLSPILAEAPKRAIKFTTNENYKVLFQNQDGNLTGFRAAAAGACAGMTECSVNTPFEVVKVRMQAKENLGRFKNMGGCLVHLVKSEGLLGLYVGLESHLWRNAFWNGTYFGCIDYLKKEILCPPEGSSPVLYNFAAGIVGGTLATLTNTPFDVVKSRMQNQIVQEGEIPQYRYTVPSLLTVLSKEGVRSVYKGVGPRLVRLGPGGGIMYVAFQFVQELLKDF
eukprot:544692_1